MRIHIRHIILFSMIVWSVVAKAQAIVDGSGNIINYQKYTDSIPGAYATGTRLRIKADSVALALVASLGLKLNISDTANMVSGYLRKTGSAATLTNFPTLNQNTTGTAGGLSANIAESQVTNLVTDLAAKQATLVSGTNIKTINGATVLGSGDLVVSGSGAPTFINLTSAFSSTSTTPATVTGWSFAVTSGKTYRIEVIADYQTAATTTGGILAISLTTATGSVRGHAKGTVVNTAAASDLVIPIRTTTGAGSSLTTTGVTAASSPHYIGLLITFTCTGSGTFNIQWATEVSTSAAQLNANSSLIYQALN